MANYWEIKDLIVLDCWSESYFDAYDPDYFVDEGL